MEISSTMQMIVRKCVNGKRSEEQWRPSEPERLPSKPLKCRRRLFRGVAKRGENSARIEKRTSSLKCDGKSTIDSRRSDDNAPLKSGWNCLLRLLRRLAERQFNAVGIEKSNGAVEVIASSSALSQVTFNTANGMYGLDELLADGRSQIVNVEYKLVPVIARVSVRHQHHKHDEYMTYTPTMKSHCDIDETLAELLDDSSSMGYASQTDATASTNSSPSEAGFFPIGSSTIGSGESVTHEAYSNSFTVIDSLNSGDSSASIYYDCDEFPASEANSNHRSHQM